MKTEYLCPDCKITLKPRAKACACGWKSAIKQSVNPEEPHDPRCEYVLDDRRCPRLGTISPSPYGKGNWFCTDHFQNLSNPLISKLILLKAEQQQVGKSNNVFIETTNCLTFGENV